MDEFKLGLRYHISISGLSVNCNNIKFIKSADEYLGDSLGFYEDDNFKARLFLNEGKLKLVNFSKTINTKYYDVVPNKR